MIIFFILTWSIVTKILKKKNSARCLLKNKVDGEKKLVHSGKFSSIVLFLDDFALKFSSQTKVFCRSEHKFTIFLPPYVVVVVMVVAVVVVEWGWCFIIDASFSSILPAFSLILAFMLEIDRISHNFLEFFGKPKALFMFLILFGTFIFENLKLVWRPTKL